MKIKEYGVNGYVQDNNGYFRWIPTIIKDLPNTIKQLPPDSVETVFKFLVEGEQGQIYGTDPKSLSAIFNNPVITEEYNIHKLKADNAYQKKYIQSNSLLAKRPADTEISPPAKRPDNSTLPIMSARRLTRRVRKPMMRRRMAYRRKYKRSYPRRRTYRRKRIFRKYYTSKAGQSRAPRKWSKARRKSYYRFTDRVESAIFGNTMWATFDSDYVLTPQGSKTSNTIWWQRNSIALGKIPSDWLCSRKVFATVCVTNMSSHVHHFSFFTIVAKRGAVEERFPDTNIDDFNLKYRHIADAPGDPYFQAWNFGKITKSVTMMLQPQQCLYFDLPGIPLNRKSGEKSFMYFYAGAAKCPPQNEAKPEAAIRILTFGKMLGLKSQVQPRIANVLGEHLTLLNAQAKEDTSAAM